MAGGGQSPGLIQMGGKGVGGGSCPPERCGNRLFMKVLVAWGLFQGLSGRGPRSRKATCREAAALVGADLPDTSSLALGLPLGGYRDVVA